MFVFAVSGRLQEMSNPNVGGSKNSNKRQNPLEGSENEVCATFFRKNYRARYRVMGTTKALQGRVQKTEWAIKRQVVLISEGRGSHSQRERERVLSVE